jgi:hypothetical protein
VQVVCSCNPSAYQISLALLNCFIIQPSKHKLKESSLGPPYRFSTAGGSVTVKKNGTLFQD